MDNESFFKMPKVLFTDEYKDLSAEAKLLYGLMLDRMQLSAINGWCDKNGEVFIFYTIAETSEMLGCGHDKATRLQRELEKHNLLRRKYQGNQSCVLLLRSILVQKQRTPGAYSIPSGDQRYGR